MHTHAIERWQHQHVFLGRHHARNERKTWLVIGLTASMMVAEITGGTLFGSMALIADGLHMSTHAAALLIAALAYTYARRHADDPRFTFGAGKFGDLAGFTSAIVLAMIALLIGYEAVSRFLSPVPIHFAEAIPIAALGLCVNIASALILGGGEHHHHGHAHDHHDHDHGHDNDDRDHHDHHDHDHHDHRAKAGHHRDNNTRAAVVHVMADAAVSVLVIVGLVTARAFGWMFMDPLAGLVGAVVIASWSWGLVRDTGAVLLDMTADRGLADELRRVVEVEGDAVADLHIWRLGPGHLGAIVSVVTLREPQTDWPSVLAARFPSVSHLTVEVMRSAA